MINKDINESGKSENEFHHINIFFWNNWMSFKNSAH